MTELEIKELQLKIENGSISASDVFSAMLPDVKRYQYFKIKSVWTIHKDQYPTYEPDYTKDESMSNLGINLPYNADLQCPAFREMYIDAAMNGGDFSGLPVLVEA